MIDELHRSVRLDKLPSGDRGPQKQTNYMLCDGLLHQSMSGSHLSPRHQAPHQTTLQLSLAAYPVMARVTRRYQYVCFLLPWVHCLHRPESTWLAALDSRTCCLLKEHQGTLSLCLIFYFLVLEIAIPEKKHFGCSIKVENSFLLPVFCVSCKMEMHWLCTGSLRQHCLKTRKKVRVEKCNAGPKHMQMNNWK